MTSIIKRVEVTTTDLHRVLLCDGPACSNETPADMNASHMGFPLTWYLLRLPYTDLREDDLLHFCGMRCLQKWAAQATLDKVYSDKAE